MTDHPVSGRFDVHATGELSGSFDSAEERARLLQALNADRDLCSALLCGEQQLLCSGVEWAQAQAFAAMLRDCGVVTRVVRHGEMADRAAETGVDERAGLADLVPASENSEESEAVNPEPVVVSSDDTVAQLTRIRPVIYDAEVVEESGPRRSAAPRAIGRIDEAVVQSGGDIPLYLLEADTRERAERGRQQRRWGLASLLVLVVAGIVAVFGGGESFSSQQAYVHLLASAVPAGAEGTVAELLVKPGQQLQPDEAVAVIVPTGAADPQQRYIEMVPAAGMVDQIEIRVGQQVRRGDALLTLARPDSAYLLAYFTPEQLRDLPASAVVQIELEDFPGQLVLGRLVEPTPAAERRAERRSRGAVRINFEDQQPLLNNLRSGMAASVTIRSPQDVD